MLNIILQTSAIHGISKEAELLKRKRDFVGSFLALNLLMRCKNIREGTFHQLDFWLLIFLVWVHFNNSCFGVRLFSFSILFDFASLLRSFFAQAFFLLAIDDNCF